jgi:transcriptional regulator with XRE-family HTH domain
MADKQTRHNGFTIRAMRVREGHKPGDFARLVGLSYPHLDNIENERKDASDEALYRIADTLRVPVDAILRDRMALGRVQAVAVRPTRTTDLASA